MMRGAARHGAVLAACALALTAVTGPPAGAASGGRDPGRQVLAPDDGWAAAAGGTTGGASADAAHVYFVHTRAELVAALGGAANTTPKIIHVIGTVDGNTGADGKPLTCADYAKGTGYDLQRYLAAYDPATWGRTVRPYGPQEYARAAAEARQAAQVAIPVPSNTTIIGVGRNAVLKGVDLVVDGHGTPGAADNVIIRDLTFSNAYDCFPQWDPTDTSVGNWNSQFDNVSVTGAATHIWIDHDTFTDAPYYDDQEPVYFGRPYQQHDGATDITKAADYVTVSWNRYEHHDKLMLIGSTDGATYDDADHLRVTVHHNLFMDVGQRAPRLRWGHVDVYDDYYVETGALRYDYLYSWGVGHGSHIYAQNNYFALPPSAGPGQVIYDWGGDAITTKGDVVNRRPVDLVAAYNATHGTRLGTDAGWTPVLRTHVDPAQAVPALVGRGAGAGRPH